MRLALILALAAGPALADAPLFLIGITAIVLRPHPDTQAPQVLLVQRSDTFEWTPIAGIVEPGEQLHEVAVREVPKRPVSPPG